ncbi:MAG TPA: PA0069 family radical SAM protein [Burkholderiales bacterium]|nr:PA0069 family radical SAM protein [Burkholderiales bacterium]
MAIHLLKPHKGRGATLNPDGRFEQLERDSFDDGWGEIEQDPGRVTTVTPEPARSIIARNDSPDVGFSQSINPYAGCEHGCIYCYARPSHGYRGLSAGLDFETKLFAKVNAAELLRRELSARSYRVDTIVVGANTDPYQPIERKWKITRGILAVLAEFNHPVGIITKSALVERDIDLLSAMAKKDLARVHVSITTLDHEIARYLEPRTSAPARRVQTIRALRDAGIPVGVMVAPVIPFLTDSQLEPILEAASEAGVDSAGYVLLRLPHEVKDLFKDWLAQHFPLKAEHVMSLVRQMRDGQEYDSTFGVRQRGTGIYAQLLAQRFKLACERLGLNGKRSDLNVHRFHVPPSDGQLNLFEP